VNVYIIFFEFSDGKNIREIWLTESRAAERCEELRRETGASETYIYYEKHKVKK
jgi:hypothetical protein